MDTHVHKPMTIDRYLVAKQAVHPAATGELTRVITQIGVVAKIISNAMRRGAALTPAAPD